MSSRILSLIPGHSEVDLEAENAISWTRDSASSRETAMTRWLDCSTSMRTFSPATGLTRMEPKSR